MKGINLAFWLIFILAVVGIIARFAAVGLFGYKRYNDVYNIYNIVTSSDNFVNRFLNAAKGEKEATPSNADRE
jgi:hypothetical protein